MEFDERPAFVGIEPQIEVVSKCYFRVDIHAIDERRALKSVEPNDIPLLQSALSLQIDGIPYQLQSLGVKGAGGSQLSFGHAKLAIFAGDKLSDDRLTVVRNNLEVIKSDKPARTASMAISQAIRLHTMGANVDELRAAALLNYYMAIEAVTSGVPTDLPENRNELAEAIVSKVLQDLRKTGNVDRRLIAIREASAAANRLDQRFGDLKARNAGQFLEMPAEWLVQVRKLGKLRNGKLGHPGGSFSYLNDWFGDNGDTPARELATSLLSAYVDHLVAKRG